MIANSIIIVFILAMAYWWALQGFFSAFLHLLLVIIAGALAFAVWEPLTMGVLMSRMPAYAWSLGLLGPFIVLLILLRIVTDRLIKANVNFQNLINNLLGGVCGIISGLLTAGIVFIGLSFLPLGVALGGVQPYAVSSKGHIEQASGGLWLPVDHLAQRVFAGLGGGAFRTATPLPDYQPDLARRADLYRMQYDKNASLVAVPGTVKATNVYVQPTPAKQLSPGVATSLGPAVGHSGRKLVLVDTKWTSAKGTYDHDQAVRISPPQIRLGTSDKGSVGGAVTLHAPVAFSHDEGKNRVFHAIDSSQAMAFGNRQDETFGWLFVVPKDQRPRFLFARHLRLPLGKAQKKPGTLARAVGKPAPKKPREAKAGEGGGGGEKGPSKVGARQGVKAGSVAQGIKLTNKLPKATSENFAPSLSVKEHGVRSGKATVEKPPSALSENTRIDSIYIPSQQGGVRVKLKRDRALSLLGGARVSAASLGGVYLKDARGGRYPVIAYAWVKGKGEQINAKSDRRVGFRSSRELPIRQMDSGDKIYLYFAVPKGAKITEYDIGSATDQKIKPPLEIK